LFVLFLFFLSTPAFYAQGEQTFADPPVRVLLKDTVKLPAVEAETGWLVTWPMEADPPQLELPVARIEFHLDNQRVTWDGATDDIIRPGPILLVPQPMGSFFFFNGTAYRGSLEIIPRNNRLRAVNLLPLEDYLRGVVPLELGIKEPEALKAQAVVARTYALAHIGRSSQSDYHLTADVGSQSYGGLNAERSYVDEAIAATRGEILFWDGKPLREALYHSTCGGRTAPADTVFGGSPLPYLGGVFCRESVNAPYRIDSDLSEDNDRIVGMEEALPADVDTNWLDDESDAFCSPSPYFRWQIEIEPLTLAEALARGLPQDRQVGIPQALNVISRDSSGRVAVLEIVGDVGIARISGDSIRRILLWRDDQERMRPLNSTRFRVVARPEGGWILSGAGWGHGVGMCQWGALGMARRGHNYEEILLHYYPGAELKVWENGTLATRRVEVFMGTR